MNIAVIVGTNRSGRVTPRLAKWVMNGTKQHEDVNFNLLDLKDYELPMLEEAPWLPDRTLTDGAKKWLKELSDSDGFIIVTAEYNHSVPAVLKNALDYTHGEVKRKPFAVVSHGVNSGVRANEHLRQIVNSNMGAFTISATVPFIGNISEALDENGEATTDTQVNNAKLEALLKDIIWYSEALKTAKEKIEHNG